MSLTALNEKIIADLVTLINFVNFIEGAGMQADFTQIQAAAANLGFAFPALGGGVMEAMIAKYGTDVVQGLTALYNTLVGFAKFTDPSYVPPVPATPAAS